MSSLHVIRRPFPALAAVVLSSVLVVTSDPEARGASPTSETHRPAETRCTTDAGQGCPSNAQQSRRRFRAGHWGESEAPRPQWPAELRRLVRRKAIKKGYVRPASAARHAEHRVGVAQSWNEFFDGLVNVIDCVAPGAESSCARDLHKIKGLDRSVRVGLKCGGMAVIVYYTGGTAMTALGAGATACFWDEAWSAWE